MIKVKDTKGNIINKGPKDKVQISLEEYNSLVITEARLNQLENNGVDNWQHYGCMCDELDEDECIFCTEDEYNFLNLKESN